MLNASGRLLVILYSLTPMGLDISTHFDPEGSQCVLQQFRDLILSEDLLENRIIAENAKAR